MIVGDQRDEGTLFALFTAGLTSNAKLAEYLSTQGFTNASAEQIADLLATYPQSIMESRLAVRHRHPRLHLGPPCVPRAGGRRQRCGSVVELYDDVHRGLLQSWARSIPVI